VEILLCECGQRQGENGSPDWPVPARGNDRFHPAILQINSARGLPFGLGFRTIGLVSGPDHHSEWPNTQGPKRFGAITTGENVLSEPIDDLATIFLVFQEAGCSHHSKVVRHVDHWRADKFGKLTHVMRTAGKVKNNS